MNRDTNLSADGPRGPIRNELLSIAPEHGGRSAADGDPETTLKPFNVWSRSDEVVGRLMSNFAHTPFELDGVRYASTEGFYVSLLFLDPVKRLKLAGLYGLVVKRMGKKSKLRTTCYNGEWFDLGSDAHVALIKRAIRAKLEAHPGLARRFVGTAPRPIVHETGYPDPPDAEFPAAVFCRVLSELREEFANSR